MAYSITKRIECVPVVFKVLQPQGLQNIVGHVQNVSPSLALAFGVRHLLILKRGVAKVACRRIWSPREREKGRAGELMLSLFPPCLPGQSNKRFFRAFRVGYLRAAGCFSGSQAPSWALLATHC